MSSAGADAGRRHGEGMFGAAKKFVGPMVALFAAKVGVDFFKGAIEGASNLSESQSKVGVVFGKASGQIMTASQTSATAMGLSKTAYLDATGGLGNLLVSLKVAPKAAADMSQQMVKLAGDMASFNNVSPEEALAAIQSGLTGETEPLKRFGVNMNDATLKAQALKMGLISSVKDAMDPQTKALAAQALIMSQTGTAQGDFARTSGGLANQQRILAAQTEDLKTKIGGALLPAVTTITTAVNGFVGEMQSGTGTGGAFVGFFKNLWTAIQPIGAFITGTVIPAIKGLFDLFVGGNFTGGLGKALGIEEDSPIVGQLFMIRDTVMAAFGAVKTFILTQLIPAFMSVVTTIQAFVAVALPIVQAFVAGMMARIEPMMPTIKAIFATIGQIITAALGLIQAVISRVTTVIAFVWKTWGSDIMNFIAGVFAKILVVIQAALSIIQGVIKTVTAVIKGDWSGAWDGIKAILSGAWDLIKGIVSAALTVVKGALSGAWALIKAGASAAWDGIKSAVSAKVGELVSFVQGVPGRIVSALGNLGSLLYQKGREIIQGLIDGVMAMVGAVGSAISSVVGKIADALPGSPVKEGPLRVLNHGYAGGQIVKMLTGGIDGQRGSMAASMASLVKVPSVGTLDFASSSQRANAVGGPAGNGATSADIAALGDRIGAELDRQARTIQTMQRQMAGAR